jgi:excinuclease UvrABC ATPase subunit
LVNCDWCSGHRYRQASKKLQLQEKEIIPFPHPPIFIF